MQVSSSLYIYDRSSVIAVRMLHFDSRIRKLRRGGRYCIGNDFVLKIFGLYSVDLFKWLPFSYITIFHSYVSQFTVETYCFADGRCLFKQPQSVIYHWNQYDEEISKKCRSFCPFVMLTKKAYSSIINSRKIILISGERA